jgi:hypothetical protein
MNQEQVRRKLHPCFGASVELKSLPQKFKEHKQEPLNSSMPIIRQGALHDFAVTVFAVEVRVTRAEVLFHRHDEMSALQ